MLSAAEISRLSNVAIVAPAGHGKTEIISNVAALGRRTLVLTHTHAGVHAIRSRLKRLGVPHNAVSVDTIAGWSMRYAYAFPGIAHPPAGMPQGAEWDQLYRGAIQALRVGAIRDVVAASYDRILIDEYQDCGSLQHELALALSGIVPTLIFGDPMQGIFEFAEPSLSWPNTIHPRFPYAGTLQTPHRWASKNPELGAWIAETRDKLMRGEVIDLESGPIEYRQATSAFDMSVFFDGIDTKEGTFAAIHCRKRMCYDLAKATSGGYQAIEEMAGIRLQSFALAWDRARNPREQFAAITSLLDECFNKKQQAPGEAVDVEDAAVEAEMRVIAAIGNGIDAAQQYFALSRRRRLWRLFRNEIWRDAERAISEICAGRSVTMDDAVARIRQRTSNSGRRLPKRTISTPLLLKGLEFDHVVIPDATHFTRESQAQAKLFYVAISRATLTLTVASSSRYLQFPQPII